MLDRAFGMDVHKDMIVIGKLVEYGSKETRKFGVSQGEIQTAIDWLKKDNCMDGVMESTGIYWVPIYAQFKEAGFNICVANAYQVKSVPGRKSDFKDAEWLAYLLRAELIKPSYIPDEKYEELRTLTRLRRKLVQTETSFKNRVHKMLELCNIRLSSKISNLFGPSGSTILDAIMSGGDIDKAIDSCSKKIRAKKDEIKQSIMGKLNQTDLFELKICLDNIKLLEDQIKQIDEKILSKIDPALLEKLVKLPGVAPATAATAIAEIAEPTRFENEKKVAGWTGLAPARYQSAGKDKKGHITKQGDVWLRNAMVQAARSAANSESEFGEFYSRIAGRRGKSVATLALARLLLTKIWNIIKTGEEYVSNYTKKAKYKLKSKVDQRKYDPAEITGILSRAFTATAGTPPS
jgi:transposase